MRQVKSERLKKIEAELEDLEQWLKLGLVPKKDIPKHKEEIEGLRERIEQENARLKFLKESGEVEEYTAPKRASGRTGYTEMGSLPDVDNETGGVTEAGYQYQTEGGDADNTIHGDDDDEDADDKTQGDTQHDTKEETEEEDEWSDRNRWRRGGIVDPEADEW